MPHNTQIDHVMHDIILKLMSSLHGHASPELWMIYPKMQKWLMQVGTAESTDTAKAIAQHLDTLPDRGMAQEIEEALRHFAPQAFEGNRKLSLSAFN